MCGRNLPRVEEKKSSDEAFTFVGKFFLIVQLQGPTETVNLPKLLVLAAGCSCIAT
jgi:hypothetical protein